MIVSIRVAEESRATATLVDGENLRQFHVEVDGVDDVDAAEALQQARLGRFADRQTAWISIAAVREHFAAALGPAWVRQFASTIDYAALKGWRSEDEKYLQAHVVRLGKADGMRLGCDLPYLRDPGAIRAFAQAAEAIGYDHLAFSEHVATSPSSPFPPRVTFDDEWHETYTLLGFLCGVTSDIELMSSMHLLPLRPAVLAAKQAAEIDLLSGGRLRLGVAVGWNPREYDALGVRPSTRGQLLEEQIDVLRLLWSRDVVTYRGRFIQLDEVAIRPRPDRTIPIWIGAGSSATHGRPTARALRRIARLADGYKMFAPLGASPRTAQEIVGELRDHVLAAGRSVDEVGIETRLLPHVTPRHQWAELVRSWAEAGTTHLGLGNRMAGGDVDAQISLIADVKAEIGEANLAPGSNGLRTLATAIVQGAEVSEQTYQAPDTIRAMLGAASAFLAALPFDQRASALQPMDDPRRLDWDFVPKPDRGGVPLSALDRHQRVLAHNLLARGFSLRGYGQALTIMAMENVLRELQVRTMGMAAGVFRNPDEYFLSFYGRPALEDTWGWRVLGHHLSVSYTIIDQRLLTVTPCNMGAQPAQSGVLAPLRTDEDLGFALLDSLTEQQRKTAVIHHRAPADYATRQVPLIGEVEYPDYYDLGILSYRLDDSDREALKFVRDEPAGICGADLDDAQAQLLLQITDWYFGRVPDEVADVHRRRLERHGLGNLFFSWAGGEQRGVPHYYRVHGHDVLIEFDNAIDQGNHIHSVWRDLNNDLGHDLLLDHYERERLTGHHLRSRLTSSRPRAPRAAQAQAPARPQP